MLTQLRDAAQCTFCPKLCRSACPVSSATGREALTPQAKVAEVGAAAARGSADPRSAEAAFACSGCLRCAEHCRLGVEPAEVLFRHRADVVGAGVAPKVSADVARLFHEQGCLGAGDLAGQLSRIAARSPVGPASAKEGLFAGCTAVTRAPGEVRAAFAVAQALGVPLGAEPAGGLCCGYPLWAAGHRDSFARHAREFARRLRRRSIHALDPGCAYTLGVLYPEAGVELGADVRPFVDLVAERLPAVNGRPRLSETAVYHDACLLGRGLGRYEEPRTVLRAVVERLVEPTWSRSEARCSGGGGLLPRTSPEVSDAIAAERAAELAEAAPLAVTACPASAGKLQGAGARVEGFAALLARWLSV